MPVRSHGDAQDEIVGPDVVADVKGRDTMVHRFADLFGLAVAATD
jgi:hypothetical protein